jgi:hypothetical protein
MQPEQENQSQQPAPTTPPQPQQPLSQEKPAFYRQYWPFGLIFIFAPFGLIFGIIILLTGEVYKNTNGTYFPISKKEKTTLLIVGIALQILGTLSVLR